MDFLEIINFYTCKLFSENLVFILAQSIGFFEQLSLIHSKTQVEMHNILGKFFRQICRLAVSSNFGNFPFLTFLK